ncbi:MAG: SpoIIIAH-like family protein [Clostridium sp.]|nr:SpoIIIAH-like family protein [Clostridium sp.]
MKKIGFRFTKKGIIALALLLVLLAGAIYLNIKLNNDQTSVMDVIGKEDETGKLEPVDAKVYNDYFINFRSERNNIRAQEIDYLRSIISQQGTDKETLDNAQNRLLELVNNMEQEFSIENKIKARGFLDAAVLFKNGMVSVIIDGDSLTDEDVARILDIVKNETGIAAEQIRISLNNA